MAKLSAHGAEVGRINFTTYAKAYMADGAILKNYGQGWKLYGKCKVSPEQAFSVAKEKHDSFMRERPALAEYRKELHALAGMGKAWKLHAALELLGDDVDGVWSEACDGYGDNVHADISEVEHLARLYRVACAESADLKQAAAA